MDPNFIVWCAGNIILPAIPVASVVLAHRIAKKTPAVESVLRDGILYFYVVGLCALFIMDLWKAGGSGEATGVNEAAAAALFVTCLLTIVLAAGAYFVMALANTGVLDKDKEKFDLKELANWSWQSASVIAICVATARLLTGVY